MTWMKFIYLAFLERMPGITYRRYFASPLLLCSFVYVNQELLLNPFVR